MGDAQPITLPAELAGAVRTVAEWRGMSPERYVQEVVAMAARLDAELAAEITAGEGDLSSGRSYTQQEIETMFGVTKDRLDSFVQEGIDAIERGDVVPHDDIMAELDAMIATHRARCG